MAKFNYKKWVTENKYGKLNEQAGSSFVKLKSCAGSLTTTGCLPNASNYSLGHQFKFQSYQGPRAGYLMNIISPSCPSGMNNLNIIEDPYVGACANNNIAPNIPSDGTGGMTDSEFTGSITPVPIAGQDAVIGSAGGPTPAGTGSFDDYGIDGGTQFSYPDNWSVTGWTDNFVDMMLNHPNPCNFLNQRYNQFGNQLQQGGMGPLQTNLTYQKFAVVHALLGLTGCGLPNPNPFTSLLQEQINEIKLDPAAKQILQKREKEIRGLSRKKETGKRRRRNENKISALKRIIKETLSELQEKQKACSCRNGVCKTAGGNLCPSHECGGKCKGSENTVDRKDK